MGTKGNKRYRGNREKKEVKKDFTFRGWSEKRESAYCHGITQCFCVSNSAPNVSFITFSLSQGRYLKDKSSIALRRIEFCIRKACISVPALPFAHLVTLVFAHVCCMTLNELFKFHSSFTT